MGNFINLIINAIIMITASLIFSKILLQTSKISLKLKNIVLIIIIVIMYSITANIFNGSLKTLIMCALSFILFKNIFKVNSFKTILLVFVYTIISIIPDVLVMLFVIYVLKINPELCYTSYANTLISTLAVCILLVGITYLLRKVLRKILNIKLDNNKAIIICTILALGSVILLFYNAFWYIKINENLFFSIIIMITFIAILFNLIKQKLENNKILNRYDKLLEFIKEYEIAIDEQKMIRHENKNQLITIRDSIEKERGKESVINYINSILKEYKTYSEDKYGKYQYLPSNGIKGLFYYKSMEAEEKGINLSINVSEKVKNSILEKLPTEDFKQLGRLIGIYLDNAIEASLESQDKKLGIEIYTHKKDIVIIITNTYNGIIDEESVGKVKYTTKGKNHGYGLMMANKILNESKLFSSEKRITEKLYEQKLTIKNSID